MFFSHQDSLLQAMLFSQQDSPLESLPSAALRSNAFFNLQAFVHFCCTHHVTENVLLDMAMCRSQGQDRVLNS